MFELEEEEQNILRSQIGTLKNGEPSKYNELVKYLFNPFNSLHLDIPNWNFKLLCHTAFFMMYIRDQQ